MNSADQLIYNASLLVDADDIDGAMASLEEAIALADVARFPLQLLRARLLLGELLLYSERQEEAMVQFRGVLVVSAELDEDASVDEEVAVAAEYLAQLDHIGG